MAVWQFDVFFVSRSLVLKRFGEIPTRITEFESSDNEVEVTESSESLLAIDVTSEVVVDAVSSLLPPMGSWSVDARMFGDSEGNKVELWEDLFLCRIDLRNLDRQFVSEILKLARSLDCVLVCKDNGRVLLPDDATLVAEISASRAQEFLSNPVLFLKKLGDR